MSSHHYAAGGGPATTRSGGGGLVNNYTSIPTVNNTNNNSSATLPANGVSKPFSRNPSNMFCHLCLQSIPTPSGNFTISFDQFYYHRECFKCVKCDKYLSESDAYVTNETNKLLNCISCSIKRKSVTASANIQSMIASINNSNASCNNNNNNNISSLPATSSSFQATPLQPTIASNKTVTSNFQTPCTPIPPSVPLNNTLNDLKSKFESNPRNATSSSSNQRLVQNNFAVMSINNELQTPTTNGSSTTLSSASTLTLCNSNSSVVSRSSYFNQATLKPHNTPNSILASIQINNGVGEPTVTSRLSVNLRRSAEGQSLAPPATSSSTTIHRLSSSPSTTSQHQHQARRVTSPVSPARPTSNNGYHHHKSNQKSSEKSNFSNNGTSAAAAAAVSSFNTSGASSSASNWVNVYTHTAKCNIMQRKKRRGNKRSKSLPARFSIDSLLEYFNYSMLLNKYELKKLHQQHNAYYLNISSNRSTATATNKIATAAANTTIKLNRVPSSHASSTMPYRLNSTTAPAIHHHHHTTRHTPQQYQLSSGYNSENHSNSSNSTSTTTIYAPNTTTGATQINQQSHLLNQQSVLNFYRLSLNHLPLNFTNTQCTCGGGNGGSSIAKLNNTPNGRKALDSITKSSPLNNNNTHNISLNKSGGMLPLSSSPNNGHNPISHQCDDEDEDGFSDDDDLDEDLDMEEDEDEEMAEEENNCAEFTEDDKNKLENDPIKLSNHSLVAKAEAAAQQNDKFSFNTVTRAHGTSNCPHTAKVDIRRVRSCADLTQKQAIYNEEDFEFKEKLGEGFFANVKKCVWKQTGREMVLKELKLNCVNLKKRSEDETGNGSLDSCDSYEQQQPRIDLMINYAELNAAHKSFLKEAQVLRNLNHPNVIKFLGVMFAKERQFNLILEYIGGGTLKDIIHNIAVPLPWKLRVGYAKDIAAAMQYLHSLNIIHRDLKSDNCLVRENGRTVVVADFGLSRINNSSFFSGTCAMSSRSRRSTNLTSANINNNAGDSLLFQDLNDSTSSTLLKFQNLLGQQQQQTHNNLHYQSPGSSNHSSSATNSFIVAAKRKLKRRGGYSNMNQQSRLKHRYAVVGNSFSMAPEMLKHQIYDERVDIFSFGIICCEIIGRVQADPDYLPRTSDFGLNVELFRKKYCEADCPKHFVRIAIACCELEPEKRPPFSKTHLWLETILSHLEANNPLPKNLLKNILDSNTKRPTSSTFSNNNGAAPLPNLTAIATPSSTSVNTNNINKP